MWPTSKTKFNGTQTSLLKPNRVDLIYTLYNVHFWRLINEVSSSSNDDEKIRCSLNKNVFCCCWTFKFNVHWTLSTSSTKKLQMKRMSQENFFSSKSSTTRIGLLLTRFLNHFKKRFLSNVWILMIGWDIRCITSNSIICRLLLEFLYIRFL